MEVVRKIQLTVMKVPDVGGIPGTGLSTTAAGAPVLHMVKLVSVKPGRTRRDATVGM